MKLFAMTALIAFALVSPANASCGKDGNMTCEPAKAVKNLSGDLIVNVKGMTCGGCAQLPSSHILYTKPAKPGGGFHLAVGVLPGAGRTSNPASTPPTTLVIPTAPYCLSLPQKSLTAATATEHPEIRILNDRS